MAERMSTPPICGVCQQLPLKRARYLDALLACEQALMQADGTLGFLQYLGKTLDADYRSLAVEAVADEWRDQLEDIGQRVTSALEALVDGELPIDRLCDPTPALYQHVVAGMQHFEYLQERERARTRPAWDKQRRHIEELPAPERDRLLRLMHTPMSEEVVAAHDADDQKVWRRALERAHRSGDLPAPGAGMFDDG
jgi:hypothetical protein